MRKNKAKKTTECIVQMHCIFQVFKARFCDHTVLPYMRNQRSLNPPKIRSFPVPETLPERRGAIAFLATAPFSFFRFSGRSDFCLSVLTLCVFQGKESCPALPPVILPSSRNSGAGNSLQKPAISSGKALSRE